MLVTLLVPGLLAGQSGAQAPAGAAAGIGKGTTGIELVDFSLDAATVRASSVSFELLGILGQPDAEPLHPATGGPFEFTGGFLAVAVAAPALGDPIFRDGFEATP